MTIRLSATLAVLIAMLGVGHAQTPGDARAPRAGAAPAKSAPYTPARTPWGDPDLQGAFTNSDESLIPLERPDALPGRTLDDITAGRSSPRSTRSATRHGSRPTSSAGSCAARCTGSRTTTPKNSRAWLVVDPPDGKVPPQTAEARQRAAARAEARKGRGEADSYEDRSLYDRCISRGLPGSMMPAIYGSSYADRAGPRRRRHRLRDGQRDARDSARRPAARRPGHPHLHGRRSRPLRGQHARRRDHELHRQASRTAARATR